MEIERKFLIKKLPDNLETYQFHLIEQGYLNVNPVVRVRREDNNYYLTYKGSGMMAREEYNLPLNAEAYSHLIKKTDGNIITKKRYLIPLKDNLTIELDIFEEPFAPLIMAEVEFPSIEEANNFTPPDWFGDDVTLNPEYHNSHMSKKSPLSKLTGY